MRCPSSPLTLLCLVTVVYFKLSDWKLWVCVAPDWFTWSRHCYSAFLTFSREIAHSFFQLMTPFNL